ncbi:class A beta-lactamase [Brevibacterium salitolerans]|uniref:Beta-lactamase n=1 Tax=Brevibacterium salitolerans TaxID=1403566 RepID=A0ABN2X6Y9_9MICO
MTAQFAASPMLVFTRLFRSTAVLGVLSLALLSACGGEATTAPETVGTPPSSEATESETTRSEAPEADSSDFLALEDRFDARVGVYAVDTGTGREVSWRGDERFAYASTIKALAAAALLEKVGTAGLTKTVTIEESDIVSHSPVTETRVGQSMSLEEVCEAALTQSDNTAANVLFAELGGPEAFDAQLNALGDTGTTVSRIEPELNEALPGDPRDTTTPRASAQNLREYVFGEALDDEETAALTTWMKNTRTGDTLVRAELPDDWTVGDKSGGGMYGSRGDLAVVWPTDGAPLVISVLSSREEEDAGYDDRLVSGAAAAAVEQLQ